MKKKFSYQIKTFREDDKYKKETAAKVSILQQPIIV